eukprot:Sspe_Gene.109821::Locus_90011_Transcript_1_1_Confidence_1.000_Length_928::g.109821::m.109821
MEGLPDWFQYGDELAFSPPTPSSFSKPEAAADRYSGSSCYGIQQPQSHPQSQPRLTTHNPYSYAPVESQKVSPLKTRLKELADHAAACKGEATAERLEVLEEGLLALADWASGICVPLPDLPPLPTPKAKAKDQGQPVSNVEHMNRGRPCPHNAWDNLRARRGVVTLRCRKCQCQWRTPSHTTRRCPLFDIGKCANEQCPKLHVFRSKKTSEDFHPGEP